MKNKLGFLNLFWLNSLLIIQRIWILFFYPALFAIREVTHDSTGFSPFELLLGAQPKGVLSVYKDLITNKEVSGTIRDTYSYLLKLRKRIFTSWNLAQNARPISGQKSRDYADKNRKLVKFRPNDKVLILFQKNQTDYWYQGRVLSLLTIMCHWLIT